MCYNHQNAPSDLLGSHIRVTGLFEYFDHLGLHNRLVCEALSTSLCDKAQADQAELLARAKGFHVPLTSLASQMRRLRQGKRIIMLKPKHPAVSGLILQSNPYPSRGELILECQLLPTREGAIGVQVYDRVVGQLPANFYQKTAEREFCWNSSPQALRVNRAIFHELEE